VRQNLFSVPQTRCQVSAHAYETKIAVVYKHMPNVTVVGGNNAILKTSQLVDEIIKTVPATILNRLSGVSLICSFMYSSVPLVV